MRRLRALPRPISVTEQLFSRRRTLRQFPGLGFKHFVGIAGVGPYIAMIQLRFRGIADDHRVIVISRPHELHERSLMPGRMLDHFEHRRNIA